MRTVSLSSPIVQQRIAKSFVPLMVPIDHGTKEFPLPWPALKAWDRAYQMMGGPKTNGITACCVITPDRQMELGNTGSAFIWEMFESIAYDPKKFAAMLDRSLDRFEQYQRITSNMSLPRWAKQRQLAQFQRQVTRAKREEGRFHFPPSGFSKQGAVELFELSGDLKKSKSQSTRN